MAKILTTFLSNIIIERDLVLPLARQLDGFLWFILDMNLGLCKAGTENLVSNLRVLGTVTGTNLVVCTLEPPGSWYSQ